MGQERNRRELLVGAGLLGAGLLWPARGGLAAQKKPPAPEEKKQPAESDEVSPGEDLMREHGVLNRVLLVYEESARRLEAREELPIATVAEAAGLIRSFIEGYHEKLEEEQLFPRLEKAGRLVELVRVLRQQHQAGRALTGEILRLAVPATLSNGADAARLDRALRDFSRMYRPHEAREDTVLFPAFHELVGQKQYLKLGAEFEDHERELVGEQGFEKAVAQVAKLEATLGLDDLARFTPRAL